MPHSANPDWKIPIPPGAYPGYIHVSVVCTILNIVTIGKNRYETGGEGIRSLQVPQAIYSGR